MFGGAIIYLLNLAGEISETRLDYLPAERAYVRLKQLTGEDHGYDVGRWRECLERLGKIPVSRREKLADGQCPPTG